MAIVLFLYHHKVVVLPWIIISALLCVSFSVTFVTNHVYDNDLCVGSLFGTDAFVKSVVLKKSLAYSFSFNTLKVGQWNMNQNKILLKKSIKNICESRKNEMN